MEINYKSNGNISNKTGLGTYTYHDTKVHAVETVENPNGLIPATKIYYTHKDHLGSIISITDGNGSAVFKASYDAWGQQTITANTFKFHRGFSGHEHLPEFGLINMNGRMYDPIVGRFLSPDPFVQAPDFSQSFNRYSYCINNPLKYTDPTGEVFGIDDLIFIGAMVYMAGVQSNFMHSAKNGTNPFNPGNWNWKNPWTYISMASAGFSTYAETLEKCVYLVDVTTKEKTLFSHFGDGLFDLTYYGEWIDNHSAFKIYSSVLKDVPLGGVDNIRNIANNVNSGNSFINWLRMTDEIIFNSGRGGWQPGGTVWWSNGPTYSPTRYTADNYDFNNIDNFVLMLKRATAGPLNHSSLDAARGLNAIRALEINKSPVSIVGTPKPDSVFCTWSEVQVWTDYSVTMREYSSKSGYIKDTAEFKKRLNVEHFKVKRK